ncbi:MAG: fold metallo-hydrolase [Acidobacteria bacterium]|nr:fold metallo-hydrolase [Acidobacteriota bacterium]
MKKCLLVAAGLIAVGFGFAQQQSGALKAEKITDTIYVVKGGLANTGFVIGEKEVVAIDAQMTADGAQKMIDEIKKTTPKPLTKIILTHSDADHVNGLPGFPQGIEIISSLQAKNEMAEAAKAPNSQALQAYLPTRTFTDNMTIELGTERIQLLYFGPAHTSGDAVVFFPARKLAFVGDLVFIGRDPLIHRQKGGNSTGVTKTLKALIDLDADRYVPGHGDILSKSDVEGAMKNLQEKQEKVRAMIREGKSLDDVKKAFGVAESAKPGGMRFPSLVEVIYLEFSGK